MRKVVVILAVILPLSFNFSIANAENDEQLGKWANELQNELQQVLKEEKIEKEQFTVTAIPFEAQGCEKNESWICQGRTNLLIKEAVINGVLLSTQKEEALKFVGEHTINKARKFYSLLRSSGHEERKKIFKSFSSDFVVFGLYKEEGKEGMKFIPYIFSSRRNALTKGEGLSLKQNESKIQEKIEHYISKILLEVITDQSKAGDSPKNIIGINIGVVEFKATGCDEDSWFCGSVIAGRVENDIQTYIRIHRDRIIKKGFETQISGKTKGKEAAEFYEKLKGKMGRIEKKNILNKYCKKLGVNFLIFGTYKGDDYSMTVRLLSYSSVNNMVAKFPSINFKKIDLEHKTKIEKIVLDLLKITGLKK